MASEREREKEDEGPEPPWVARGVIEAQLSLSSVPTGGRNSELPKEGARADYPGLLGHQNQPGRSPELCEGVAGARL